MEGEFDTDRQERGGCPPTKQFTVGYQWKQIRAQLGSGVPEKNKDKRLKGPGKLWEDLKQENGAPSEDARKKYSSFPSYPKRRYKRGGK